MTYPSNHPQLYSTELYALVMNTDATGYVCFVTTTATVAVVVVVLLKFCDATFCFGFGLSSVRSVLPFLSITRSSNILLHNFSPCPHCFIWASHCQDFNSICNSFLCNYCNLYNKYQEENINRGEHKIAKKERGSIIWREKLRARYPFWIGFPQSGGVHAENFRNA